MIWESDDMVSKYKANLKHSQCFAEILLRADRQYERGGIHIEQGLRLFDENVKNIEVGQAWAALRGIWMKTLRFLHANILNAEHIVYICDKNQRRESDGLIPLWEWHIYVVLNWSRSASRQDWTSLY